MARSRMGRSSASSSIHGTAHHPTLQPLKAVSLLRKTSKPSTAAAAAAKHGAPTLLPRRGDTTLFAEVDRAAGGGQPQPRRANSGSRISRMTAAAELQAERAAQFGTSCAEDNNNNDCDVDCNKQSSAGMCHDDDNMCASPPPPLTTITIDLQEDEDDAADEGEDCASAESQSMFDEEQPTDCAGLPRDDAAMSDQEQQPPPPAGGGGVIYAPRPILRQEDRSQHPSPPQAATKGPHQSRRRVSWNESVGYALIPTLSEMPARIRRDMYYTADEEAAYRSDAKDEIRELRRHPAVVRVNQTAAIQHGNDLFAPRDYHAHSTLASNVDGNDDVDADGHDNDHLYHCTRGVEHHLLPRDLRRERSSRIRGVVEAVLYDQYVQHERGVYDEERLARVSQKRTRPFRRRARELAKADEAEMIAWLSRDVELPTSRRVDERGDNDSNNQDEPRDDHPMDQSSKSLRIEEAVLPPPASGPTSTFTSSSTFKDKFDGINNEVVAADGEDGRPRHPHYHNNQDHQGMNLDCDDFADVNLDSYTSLDQRLEQQYHREMSERLMARICR